MQAPENSFAPDNVVSREAVAMFTLRRRRLQRYRNTRPEAHVDPGMVKVRHPAIENLLEVSFTQGDDEVQALPPHSTDEALTKCIRFRRPHRRPQYSHTRLCHRLVQFL